LATKDSTIWFPHWLARSAEKVKISGIPVPLGDRVDEVFVDLEVMDPAPLVAIARAEDDHFDGKLAAD
jgi:hypothetical protein